MTDARPLLNPPSRGWLRDLPGPNQTPHETPHLYRSAPNHVDNIYLELPRSYLEKRGLLVWLSPIMFLWPCVLCWFALDALDQLSLGMIFLVISSVPLGIVGGLIGVRMDVSAPRDLPLRFNRARRKVYAYEFESTWWNPFVRWPVRTVAYNWDDIRAEAWRQQGATANGGYVVKWGVTLSVVKPGTNEVIDRFQLGAKADNEAAWAYICTYMQKGPQALPPSKWQPRDWNNEPTINLARLLAPKVKWPPQMDIESTTAPSEQNRLDSAELCGGSKLSSKGK